MKEFFFSVSLMIFLFCQQINSHQPDFCPYEELSVPISSQTVLGFSGEELLSKHFSSSVVSFNWRDEPKITAHLEFVPSTENVKIIIYSTGNECRPGPASISIDGFILLRTDDGRADLRCHAKLWTNDNTDAFLEMSFCADLQQLPNPSMEYDSSTSLLISIQNQQIDGIIYRTFNIPRGEDFWEMKSIILGTIGEGWPRLIIE